MSLVPYSEKPTTGLKFPRMIKTPSNSSFEKRRRSMIELLQDLYDPMKFDADAKKRLYGLRSMSVDTDSTLNDDQSSLFSDSSERKAGGVKICDLQRLSVKELRKVNARLKYNIAKQSQLLVCYLKRRDHQYSRLQAKCDLITAILQALSPKRSVDAKLQFTPEPTLTETGYEQWLNGMKAVARLPDGIPDHFRQKLWLTLADHYVREQNLDWINVLKWTFNDHMNPDDDELSLQIVKDLHRTGWSGLEGDKERILLRRVLLAYARYNKNIGYCQGFNVIAALILEITEYNEENSLKVIMMLLEHVLPTSYFDQTLRALTVDMAVLREMMTHRLPRLSAHLDELQKNSESEFEPPLVNVFSMQWLLTLYATCLPKRAVHRIWDSLMLEGSEILLRTALALWAKTGKRLMRAKTADQFYTQMGMICQELAEMSDDQCNNLVYTVYSMAPFPYPGLEEMRNRHMFNIQPFSSAFKLIKHQAHNILKSSENGDENPAPDTPRRTSEQEKSAKQSRKPSTDLSALEKQYRLLRQRQKQAAIIVQNVLNKSRQYPSSTSHTSSSNSTNASINNGYTNQSIDNNMFNHLYLKKSCNFPTMTLNGTLPLSSKAVQPSGKVKKSSINSSTTISSSVKTSRSSSITTVNMSRQSSYGDSTVTGYSKPSMKPSQSVKPIMNKKSSPRFFEKVRCHFRRRSLDDLDLIKKFHYHDFESIRQKLSHIRRSNSCFSFSEEKTVKKYIANGQNENVDFLAPKKQVYNPFPVKRQTHLIERGKKIGLYANR